MHYESSQNNKLSIEYRRLHTKRIELGCTDQDGSYYWIEGIGELYTGDYCLIDGINGFVGCVIDSLESQVYMSDWIDKCWITTSTVDEDNEVFKIYPNPTYRHLQISGIDHFDGVMTITDVAGKELMRKTIQFSGAYDVDLSELQGGTYVIQLQEKDRAFEAKKILHIK